MDFFGIGPLELLLILVLALLLFGPARLVKISRQLGKTTRSLGKAFSDFSRGISEEEYRLRDGAKSPPGQETLSRKASDED